MRRLAAALALTVAAGALTTGCGGAGTGMLPLSWQFADGRRCDDAGAFTVSVHAGGQVLQTFACEDGLAPAQATLPAVPAAGADLDVFGLSAAGDELYRGRQHLDALPPSATITLYATGAR
jgi:hypothetical protein